MKIIIQDSQVLQVISGPRYCSGPNFIIGGKIVSSKTSPLPSYDSVLSSASQQEYKFKKENASTIKFMELLSKKYEGKVSVV